MKIIPLTQQYAANHSEQILSLEVFWAETGDKPWTLDKLMFDLPGKWDLSHVALQDGEVIGYQIGSFRTEEVIYLNKIVIDSNSRARGTGKSLLREFLQKGIESGRETVHFKVRADNPATGFYDKLGYQRRPEIDMTRPDGVASYFYDTNISEVLPNHA